jgi:hypothetical protein
MGAVVVVASMALTHEVEERNLCPQLKILFDKMKNFCYNIYRK